MSTSPRRHSWGRHAFALLCSTAFLAFVPIAAYAGLIIWSGDLGGPLNLILIPVGSVLVGGILSLVVFTPLGFVSERLGVRRVLRVVALTSLALLIVAGGAWTIQAVSGLVSRWFGIVTAGTVVLAVPLVGFLIYLFCLGFRRELPHENAA
jgi:hypothetical protein